MVKLPGIAAFIEEEQRRDEYAKKKGQTRNLKGTK
jgi:hypothetical protein